MKPEIKERIELVRQGKVPEGYKMGKLGLCPKEWKAIKFSTLFIPSCKFTDDLNKYPLYSLTIEEGITPKTERYERSHLVKKENSYKIIHPNEYAYNPMNIRFGAVARHKGKKAVSVSGYYDVFTAVSDKDLVFMDNFLVSGPMINYYNKVSTGSLIEKQRVHFSQFLNFTLPLPSLKEREKIAKILSIQDRVIQLKEKLLDEKKRQKNFLMQQLLTGKKRLFGFVEEWSRYTFCVVFDLLSTNTLSRDNLISTKTEMQNIHYGDVLIKYGEILDVDKIDIPWILEGKEPIHYSLIKDGDVIIADTAEDMTVGKATELINIKTKKIVSGLHTILCHPKQDIFSKGWLGYYLNSNDFHRQLMKLAYGSKVSSITKSELKNTILQVPSKKEQKKIVEILSTADREIELLQQEIDEEKRKKKALMQLLLTGLMRVPA